MTALTLTGCSQTTSGDSGGGGGYGSGDYSLQTFTSIAEFEAWLRKQPYTGNSAARPYNVKLNVSDLGGAYSSSGSVGSVLFFTGKYVNLDLSGSTFTIIYVDAFTSCNLTSVTIPNSVITIGASAFMDCDSLTSITIPSGVTTIGEDAFSRCTSLAAINVDPANANYSSENGVLYNKAKTTLLQYPGGKTGAFTILAGVTTIGAKAFYYCTRLTGVTIPVGVTSIGDYAFYSCDNLTSVTFQGTIPSSGFNSGAFFMSGDLRDKFYATDSTNGTPGTYTRASGGSTWTKS
jgi:hypothetical protein